MCNFIIRPIKCYATVDIESSDNVGANPVEAGEAFTVRKVKDGGVILVRDNDTVVNIDLATFVHTFSDKDPNEKAKKQTNDNKVS